VERLTAEGRTFEVLVASDVVRDGLGVELHELLPGGEWRVVMEIFRFDNPDAFEVKPVRTAITHCSNEVPLDLAKQVVAIAEREFVVHPPASGSDR
jgi:hypothetical protein